MTTTVGVAARPPRPGSSRRVQQKRVERRSRRRVRAWLPLDPRVFRRDAVVLARRTAPVGTRARPIRRVPLDPEFGVALVRAIVLVIAATVAIVVGLPALLDLAAAPFR